MLMFLHFIIRLDSDPGGPKAPIKRNPDLQVVIFVGEEEQAYILFWKFVQLCKCIITKQEFKKDEKYFEGRILGAKLLYEPVLHTHSLSHVCNRFSILT